MGKKLVRWHMGILSNLYSTGVSVEDDENWISEWYQGTESGTEDHDILISFDKKDGHASLSGPNEGFVYLYPEQVEHLKKILFSYDELFIEAVKYLEKFNHLFTPGNCKSFLRDDFEKVDSILKKAKERISFE